MKKTKIIACGAIAAVIGLSTTACLIGNKTVAILDQEMYETVKYATNLQYGGNYKELGIKIGAPLDWYNQNGGPQFGEAGNFNAGSPLTPNVDEIRRQNVDIVLTARDKLKKVNEVYEAAPKAKFQRLDNDRDGIIVTFGKRIEQMKNNIPSKKLAKALDATYKKLWERMDDVWNSLDNYAARKIVIVHLNSNNEPTLFNATTDNNYFDFYFSELKLEDATAGTKYECPKNASWGCKIDDKMWDDLNPDYVITHHDQAIPKLDKLHTEAFKNSDVYKRNKHNNTVYNSDFNKWSRLDPYKIESMLNSLELMRDKVTKNIGD